MIQLLGGVAVAGAVAAGTTAFTASGITGSVTAVGGGTTSITVAGATLGSAVLTVDNSVPANYDRITGVKVSLSASPALHDSNTKVSASITGTGGDAASATYYDCGAGSSGVWTCTLPTSTYFTAVSAISIKVAAAQV